MALAPRTLAQSLDSLLWAESAIYVEYYELHENGGGISEHRTRREPSQSDI